MKIFRPVKTNYITQKFGKENTASMLLKFYNSIGLQGHNGIDFKATKGERVYWNCDLVGEIVATIVDLSLGYGVVVITRENGKIIKHRHWHFLAIYCKVGQKLKTGDFMGWADSTGHSTGDHDHYDLKPQIEENGIIKNEFQNNGYKGAIDPMSYYTNIFVLSHIMSKKTVEGQLSVIIEKLKRLAEDFILFLKVL